VTPQQPQGALRAMLPKDRHDVASAAAIAALGYPAVAPLLPDLLSWLQDYNWPVARALAPFLAAVGEPVLPEVRRILASDDEMWKYWVLVAVVAAMPAAVAGLLRPELVRMATQPTPGEVTDEVNLAAREILDAIDRADEV
jgi:hypothetical protein